MKILLTGSTNYSNKGLITKVLKRLKTKYGDELVVLSGGDEYGTEMEIKEICKWVLGIKYVEYLPVFKQWTIDCEGNGLPYAAYNKEYNARFILSRNVKMVKDSSFVIFFSDNGTLGNKKSIKKFAEKYSKPFLLIQ